MDQKKVAIIVAHPDDEILWCGGTIINHPEWQCFVVCLCRKDDPDRAPRFYNVLRSIKANGIMSDLDDGPDQIPLAEDVVKRAIQVLLPADDFGLVITHSPAGEYTRHRRHEEIGNAVIQLWQGGQINTRELWAFAYEDGVGKYLPRPVQTADLFFPLTDKTLQKKYNMINTEYNFSKDSWEARTTPNAEAFWRFTNSLDAMNRLTKEQSL